MQLQPNQLIELHLENENNTEIFRTRVEDAYDDLVIVGVPIRKANLVPIRVGTPLNIQFKLHAGIQEGRFTNQAIVEKRFKAGLPLLQLRLLGTWEKTQERHFLRVPVSFDVLFTTYQPQGESAPQSALMLDLSGGGFLLRTSQPLELHDEIRVTFDLKEAPIIADAILVRFVTTDSGVDYGFAFVDLPEMTRKTIIQFVFQRQITLADLKRDRRE